MIKRHPYTSVGVVLAVFLVSTFLGKMIGQYHDGPWGGLPEWVNTANYVVFGLSVLGLVGLSVYLGVANLRYRRAVR